MFVLPIFRSYAPCYQLFNFHFSGVHVTAGSEQTMNAKPPAEKTLEPSVAAQQDVVIKEDGQNE